MKLNCNQMDVLISFYLENELSQSLKSQVERHLFECPECMAKYELVKEMIDDLRTSFSESTAFTKTESAMLAKNETGNSEQYKIFKTNLSAYVDNELENNDSIKIKKFTINNKKARKELEDSYYIRKLLNESYKKTKTGSKKDYTKNVLKQLELENEAIMGFHPAVNMLIIFTVSVLIVTTIVLISLNM